MLGSHLCLTGWVLLTALGGLISERSRVVNIGLEGWFSDRVQQVVGTSLAAAEARSRAASAADRATTTRSVAAAWVAVGMAGNRRRT